MQQQPTLKQKIILLIGGTLITGYVVAVVAGLIMGILMAAAYAQDAGGVSQSSIAATMNNPVENTWLSMGVTVNSTTLVGPGATAGTSSTEVVSAGSKLQGGAATSGYGYSFTTAPTVSTSAEMMMSTTATGQQDGGSQVHGRARGDALFSRGNDGATSYADSYTDVYVDGGAYPGDVEVEGIGTAVTGDGP